MVEYGSHQGISFFLLIELGPICNSIAASLCFKSCEDNSLLKSYNGKTSTGLGPEARGLSPRKADNP